MTADRLTTSEVGPEVDAGSGPADVPRDWLRGVLEPCLLALLAPGEAYGYELAGRLDDAGIGAVAGGSLYPALVRMEKQGLLASEWRAGEGGPGRKYYRLTPHGAAALAVLADQWRAFSCAVTDVLATGAGR